MYTVCYDKIPQYDNMWCCNNSKIMKWGLHNAVNLLRMVYMLIGQYIWQLIWYLIEFIMIITMTSFKCSQICRRCLIFIAMIYIILTWDGILDTSLASFLELMYIVKFSVSLKVYNDIPSTGFCYEIILYEHGHKYIHICAVFKWVHSGHTAHCNKHLSNSALCH